MGVCPGLDPGAGAGACADAEIGAVAGDKAVSAGGAGVCEGEGNCVLWVE